MKQLVWLALVVLALTAPARAASRFEVARLAVDGEVLAVVPADVDGDHRSDLVVAFKRGLPPSEKRFFALFWNREGHFGSKPDVVLPVDDAVCAFDVAEVDERSGAELVTVSRHGVSALSVHRREVTRPAVIVEEPTLFYRADPGALPRLTLVHTLAGSRGRILLVPLLGALGVFASSGGKWAAVGRLEADLRAELGRDNELIRRPGLLPSFNVGYTFPSVFAADFDGDGAADLVLALEDRIAVFKQRPGPGFEARPTYLRDFAVRSPSELSEVFASATVSVQDLDGDGIADVLVRKQVSHGIASAATTSFLYLGQKGGGFAAKPDQIIKSEGLGGTDIELVDLTGDGKPDLVVPSVSIGVWAIIRMLTTKTVKVNFQILPFLPSRRFAEQPAAERELKFKLSFAGASDLQALDIHGDYNGDRRADLAFGISDDELGIFPGVDGGGLVTREPVEKIAVHAIGKALPVDLEGRGKSDLVVYYPSTPKHRREIVLLLNRGPW